QPRQQHALLQRHDRRARRVPPAGPQRVAFARGNPHRLGHQSLSPVAHALMRAASTLVSTLGLLMAIQRPSACVMGLTHAAACGTRGSPGEAGAAAPASARGAAPPERRKLPAHTASYSTPSASSGPTAEGAYPAWWASASSLRFRNRGCAASRAS